jgi:hypothetical protein
MRITGTEITVMGEVRGIGPWSGGSEAAALTGEDQTVATGQGQIMNEAGRLPVTAAMRGAGRHLGTVEVQPVSICL